MICRLLLSLTLFLALCQSVSAGDEEGSRWSAHLDDDAECVVIRNDNALCDSSRVSCGWIVFRDGWQVAKGRYRLVSGKRRKDSLAPGDEARVDFPHVVKEMLEKGGDVSLRVTFCDSEDEDRVLAGFQFDLPRLRTQVELPPCEVPLKWTQDADAVRFECDGVGYVFSGRTGMPTSIRTGNWFKNEWLAGEIVPFAEDGSSNRLEFVSAVFSKFNDRTNSVSFDVMSEWKGRSGGLRLVQHWSVRGDGMVVAKGRFATSSPLFGYAVPLAVDDPLVDYFAHGGKSGFLGLYGEDAKDFCGMRRKTRSVSFDAGFDHLSLAACPVPFDFTFNGGKLLAFAPERTFSLVIRPEKSGGSVTCNE